MPELLILKAVRMSSPSESFDLWRCGECRFATTDAHGDCVRCSVPMRRITVIEQTPEQAMQGFLGEIGVEAEILPRESAAVQLSVDEGRPDACGECGRDWDEGRTSTDSQSTATAYEASASPTPSGERPLPLVHLSDVTEWLRGDEGERVRREADRDEIPVEDALAHAIEQQEWWTAATVASGTVARDSLAGADRRTPLTQSGSSADEREWTLKGIRLTQKRPGWPVEERFWVSQHIEGPELAAGESVVVREVVEASEDEARAEFLRKRKAEISWSVPEVPIVPDETSEEETR